MKGIRDSIYAQAARNGDALAEEIGLEETVRRQGMSLEEIMYVSEQRALRIVMMMEGRSPASLGNRIEAVPLNIEQRAALITLQSAVLDGIYIGWRARAESERTEHGDEDSA